MGTKMRKIASSPKHDFYIGDDFTGLRVYNIVPKGSSLPDGGYYNVAFIEKVKGARFPDEVRKGVLA